jgi:hypothetical protein
MEMDSLRISQRSITATNSRMDLEWVSRAVSSEADHATYQQFKAMSKTELVQAYVDKRLPNHTGLSEKQATNLLRHVLREIVGPESFDAIPELGGKDGAKLAATMFEDIVEKFFAVKGVEFKTEAVQKQEDKKLRKVLGPPSVFKRSEADSFHKTGRVNWAGKPLFSGRCTACDDICTVPFKPFANMRSPPKCQNCMPKLYATPDFVFCDNFYINGLPVKWLDCKCFYGSASCLLTIESLESQAAKYNKKFGFGAYLFAFGFCESLSLFVENTMLLDATPLDLADLIAFIERAQPVPLMASSTEQPQQAPPTSSGFSLLNQAPSMSSTYSSIKKAPLTLPSAQNAFSVPRVKENKDSASKHWEDNGHLVNADNCEEYGVDDYMYDEYGDYGF